MSTTVTLGLEGRQVRIESRMPFSALLLAFDAGSGNGAYLNCDVARGVTFVPAPLGGPDVSYELVDADGAVRGALHR